jgi:hypothetical protein
MPTPAIAVFNRNRLNPACDAARIDADRVAVRMDAATRHLVPDKPDDLEQQRALVEQAIALSPHAAVFVPVHGEQMDDWLKRTLLPVQVVRRGNCDGHDRPLAQRTCPRRENVVG